MGSGFVHGVLSEADKSLLPYSFRKQINFEMGQRCESISTLGRSDPINSHTLLGQQEILLQMGCSVEPHCKVLGFLAVPRALGLISLFLVTTSPKEAFLSGCQEKICLGHGEGQSAGNHLHRVSSPAEPVQRQSCL